MGSNWGITVDFSELDKFSDELIKAFKSSPYSVAEIAKEITSDSVKEINSDGKYHTREIPTIVESNRVTSGFMTDTEGDIFEEYGTGIVGKTYPHASGQGKYTERHTVTRNGVEYETDYWIYYKDNRFFTTYGQPAKNRIWNKREELIESIPKTLVTKLVNGIKEI